MTDNLKLKPFNTFPGRYLIQKMTERTKERNTKYFADLKVCFVTISMVATSKLVCW